jgi:hypothetical protein
MHTHASDFLLNMECKRGTPDGTLDGTANDCILDGTLVL